MTEYQVGDRVVTRDGHAVTLVANEHQRGIDTSRPKTEYPLAFLDPDAGGPAYRSVKRNGSWYESGAEDGWDIVGFQQGYGPGGSDYEPDRPASWTPGNYQPGDRVVLSDGRKFTLEAHGDDLYPLAARPPNGLLTFCRNGRWNASGTPSDRDIVCYQKGYEPKPTYKVGDRVVTRRGALVTLVANDREKLSTVSCVDTHPLAYMSPEHGNYRSVTREGNWVQADALDSWDIVRHQTPEEVAKAANRPLQPPGQAERLAWPGGSMMSKPYQISAPAQTFIAGVPKHTLLLAVDHERYTRIKALQAWLAELVARVPDVHAVDLLDDPDQLTVVELAPEDEFPIRKVEPEALYMWVTVGAVYWRYQGDEANHTWESSKVEISWMDAHFKETT